ISFSLLLNCCD
ncbi:efflux transporter, RND family, MFP subunit, partial [Vibrio parahaemolyticus AQ3810]